MGERPVIIACLIVKDEAPVIRRCLDSLRPFVDAVVVADTGSTDDTWNIVREFLSEFPGELVERPWVDFAYNRNEALEQARLYAVLNSDRLGIPYALTIDADEVLTGDPLAIAEPLDGYTLPVEYAGTHYRRLALMRLDRPWRWEGVVHEVPVLEGGSIGDLVGPTVVVRWEGARSRDPETYRRDAQALQEYLVEHPGDPRTEFYLAQSLKDAGELGPALHAYRLRAANFSGWEAERWEALYQIAALTDRLLLPDVARAYLDAFAADSRRAEPLVALARYERARERWATALMFAREACRLRPPTDVLFLDMGAYTWACWDERAIAAYYAGEIPEAISAARKALSYAPEDQRLIDNLALCEAAP